ncbi:MAG TPA: glutamyl-tRNA reductase, partial [Bacteroidetes bacterium]|nr:glutamyl-tRNA reductase [Bacteroidota bacterium]
MQAQFKVLSLSHEKAPLAIRELMHLDEVACNRLALRLQAVLDLNEILVLSTCNRTEIYYMSISDHSEAILGILCLEKGLGSAEKYKQYFEWIDEAEAAVRHLFAVSIGLKSTVIGDLQISNQVKKAYSRAAELKQAGPFVHRLLHTIFHCNKRVQQETEYRDGAASVSYAAAELAKELVAFHQAPSVLVIGAGEMGSDVARNLDSDRFSRLAVMNRSPERAQILAAEIQAEWVPYENLGAVIPQFNVVITAVQTAMPILKRAHLKPQATFDQKFLVDLSVPRGIDADVSDIPGVILYDIDEI